jgi:alpha-ketoglutarate-dependent taurine dioxygenase
MEENSVAFKWKRGDIVWIDNNQGLLILDFSYAF